VAYTISRDFDITRDVITKADATLPVEEAGAAPAAAAPETPEQ
jgi:hypothetical protein